MLVCMNAVKTSSNQRTNTHEKQHIYLSVRWKGLLQIKNRTLKAFEIVLWILNNRKGALRILRMLQALPSILASIVTV